MSKKKIVGKPIKDDELQKIDGAGHVVCQDVDAESVSTIGVGGGPPIVEKFEPNPDVEDDEGAGNLDRN